MKKALLLISFIIGACTFAYSQDTSKADTSHKAQTRTVTGNVSDVKTGQALKGVTIKVPGTDNFTKSDENGHYSLTIPVGAVIKASIDGYKDQTIVPGNLSATNIAMGGSSGGSFSPESYWVGASVGYNVNQPSGSGANNIVGGASVMINPFTMNKGSKWSLGIVGNIGNFVSTQTGTNANTNLSSNLSKLAQSASGLSVGVSATKLLSDTNDKVNAFRFFCSTIYQLNSFQIAGDTTTKSLSQWKNTVGLEFEGVQFKNGGKIHVGLAATLGLFDSASFQQIFMKQKSSMLSLDASIILPLSSQFGFLLEGTYSQYNTPVYLIGVIIRSTQAP